MAATINIFKLINQKELFDSIETIDNFVESYQPTQLTTNDIQKVDELYNKLVNHINEHDNKTVKDEAFTLLLQLLKSFVEKNNVSYVQLHYLLLYLGASLDPRLADFEPKIHIGLVKSQVMVITTTDCINILVGYWVYKIMSNNQD